jgi:hypothetical protein
MSTYLLAPTSPRELRSDQEELDRQGEMCGPDLWERGLTKAAAEDALDWLEAHGHGGCQVSDVAGKGFLVRDDRGAGSRDPRNGQGQPRWEAPSSFTMRWAGALPGRRWL